LACTGIGAVVNRENAWRHAAHGSDRFIRDGEPRSALGQQRSSFRASIGRVVTVAAPAPRVVGPFLAMAAS
jgi:hypothetical protein